MSHLRLCTGDCVNVAPAAKIGKPNSEGGTAFVVGVNMDDNIALKSIDTTARKKPCSVVTPSLADVHHFSKRHLFYVDVLET